MTVPKPTWLYRLLHVEGLCTCLRRRALHAPNWVPRDGLPYRTIHNPEIQKKRRERAIPCGPRGSLHDYVSFYFGPLSPMLLQLHTNQVPGYSERQEPLIYLVATVQDVAQAGVGFVYSDGHGLPAYTRWFDDLANLNQVDWEIVGARYWANTEEDMNRKRRKQAEFLVYRKCCWTLIRGIAVLNQRIENRVKRLFVHLDSAVRRPVWLRPDLYY